MCGALLVQFITEFHRIQLNCVVANGWKTKMKNAIKNFSMQLLRCQRDTSRYDEKMCHMHQSTVPTKQKHC